MWLHLNIKTPIKRQRQHKASPPSLIWEDWASTVSQKWCKSNTVNWKWKLTAPCEEHLSVYPEHVSQADYSHGPVFGEEAQRLQLCWGWLWSQKLWIIKRNDAKDVSPVFMTNVTLVQAGSGVEHKLKGSAWSSQRTCEGGGQCCCLWMSTWDLFTNDVCEGKKLTLPRYHTIYWNLLWTVKSKHSSHIRMNIYHK